MTASSIHKNCNWIGYIIINILEEPMSFITENYLNYLMDLPLIFLYIE